MVEKENEKRWVVLAPERILDHKDNQLIDFFTIPHPQNGAPCLYMFKQNQCFEVIKFHEKFRSWFIGNSVLKDGSLHMITQVDPLFLALPYLEKTAKLGHFTTLDNILVDETYSSVSILAACLTKENLSNVCDEKETSDFVVYRLNKEKTLDWLCSKVKVLANHLKMSNINVSVGGQASNFVKSSNDNKSIDDCIKFSSLIVFDYVASSWLDDVKQMLNIKDQIFCDESEPPLKRQKLNGAPKCSEDYRDSSVKPDKKVAVKMSAKQKQLQKIDKKVAGRLKKQSTNQTFALIRELLKFFWKFRTSSS
ncbi:ribonuclease H2 subunit B isoform X3 [Hydra vulgaris]|uniref:Ribonuclease H2 subunit B n=1 Tax=Hydra vulgaris TaxID=6087 RepID=A0ABM4B8E4_HYDVU